MRAASRTSLGQMQVYWEQTKSQVTDYLQISEQLFSLAELLESSDRLTRIFADPAQEATAKESLLRSLLSGKADTVTVELLAQMVSNRWSKSEDFVYAVYQLAILVALSDAEKDGKLEQIEDESFRLAAVLTKQTDLRQFITNEELPAADRERIFLHLLGDQVTKQITFLAVQAIQNSKGKRSVVAFIHRIAETANIMRNSVVASVTCAVQPANSQVDRLTALLTKRYKKPVSVHVAVDKSLLGGMRVLVGGDVIDGSLLSKLEAARRQVKS